MTIHGLNSNCSRFDERVETASGDGVMRAELAGGGLAPDGQRWNACRLGCFPPVQVLSPQFLRRFLEERQQLRQTGRLKFFGAHRAPADAQAIAVRMTTQRTCKWGPYTPRSTAPRMT